MAIWLPRRSGISRSDSASRSVPLNMIRPVMPAVGGSSRRSASEVADLPEPDSPTKPSVAPGAISNEILCTASRSPKRIDRSRSSSSGAAGLAGSELTSLMVSELTPTQAELGWGTRTVQPIEFELHGLHQSEEAAYASADAGLCDPWGVRRPAGGLLGLLPRTPPRPGPPGH